MDSVNQNLISDDPGEEPISISEQHRIHPPRRHPPARIGDRRALGDGKRLRKPQLLNRSLPPTATAQNYEQPTRTKELQLGILRGLIRRRRGLGALPVGDASASGAAAIGASFELPRSRRRRRSAACGVADPSLVGNRMGAHPSRIRNRGLGLG